MHSEKLEETTLWKIYQEKTVFGKERSDWVERVYRAAAKYMMDVRLTFQNYTLHDETHILNVMDAMSGLLGDQISRLTVGEMELLILAACLHDLGMVYTEREKQQCYQDKTACRKFLRTYCPELLGYPPQDWTEDIRRWYLRTLHPFRLPQVLHNAAWKDVFDKRPLDMVPERCVIAVCQAHGAGAEELLHNRDLEYLSASEVDPLFCALLLRLSDLLDFDDTRAPHILYGYAACNAKSRAEWDKHQASAGFRYPPSPSADDLPYKARCTNPGIEHAVRDFLDWVDEELASCAKLQKHCRAGWQREFPFPRAVRRKEIESDGYMSGDFCLTMDQEQILKLLTGENLYDSTDVFIRELLQNAIDATLLRGEMEPDFIPEQSRIDLWEWYDQEGNIWFRIDDQGTGMTLGMLQRYFLKVGNSYYNSRELDRDLRDHGQTKRFNGISRFGIGFLSCFLCADYAEVSTLYFDPDKNRREEEAAESYQTICYGLRLQVSGLRGYFTLKNQAKYHQTEEELPAPPGYAAGMQKDYERDGYREKPGTSIVIRLNPGKLGTLNLREAVKKYLFGARIPVFYNNRRIGKTYEELMRAAHELEGEKIYELTPELKKQFDDHFPAVRGQYPKIVVSVTALDGEKDRILHDFSGVVTRFEVRFDKKLRWSVKDQVYEVVAETDLSDGGMKITLSSRNKNRKGAYWRSYDDWKKFADSWDTEEIAALRTEFDRCSVCPRAEDIMKVWQPFADQMDLYEIWKMYHDAQQYVEMRFLSDEVMPVSIGQFCPDNQFVKFTYVYQGIVAGNFCDYITFGGVASFAVFLSEGMWKPTVEVSRSGVSGLPLKVLVAIGGICHKYGIEEYGRMYLSGLQGWQASFLKEWREVRNSEIDSWMRENLYHYFLELKQMLQKPCKDSDSSFLTYDTYNAIFYKYLKAYLQDTYEMTINYEEGQILSFYEKEEQGTDDIFDLLPPMLFCKAATAQSRRYLCSANPVNRRGITVDHPFMIWFLEHAILLMQYYQRQFWQIVNCICDNTVNCIIEQCNEIREQLLALPGHHGVDVSAFPKLSDADFWVMETET